MTFMSRTTGLNITYEEHVRQSINDLLTTLPGERIFLNDYGASLRDLIDSPLTPGLLLSAKNRISKAVYDYEPRVKVKLVEIIPDISGSEFQVRLHLYLYKQNENIVVEGVIR